VVKSVPALLVLKALANEPAHGYRIAVWLNKRTDGQLELKEGTLYPLLHNLERQGLIEGEWRREAGDREVRVYQLTERGRGRLREDEKKWRQLAVSVDAVLQDGGAASESV
jgi:DNA-binding PadR family transcriptional regulator